MRRGRNSIFGTAYRYRDVQWKELNAKYLCLHLPRESQAVLRTPTKIPLPAVSRVKATWQSGNNRLLFCVLDPSCRSEFSSARVLLFNKYIYKPGQFGCAFTTTTKNETAQCQSLFQTRTEDSLSPPPTPQTSESHLAPLSLAASSHSAYPYLIVTPKGVSSQVASISPLTFYLLFSIPIPANTRGIPVSSFVPHSPPTGTSPRTSSFSFSTSPSTSYLRNASGVFQGIARQLTAFLPPDYPTEEDHEKRQGKTKVLLLENVNLDAAEYLKSQGYEVSIQNGFLLFLGCWHYTWDFHVFLLV